MAEPAKRAIPSLQAELDGFTEQALRRVPDSDEVIARLISDLREAGMEQTALREGDAAPDFSLPNASGGRVRLRDLLVSGPAVVAFYRGDW